MSYPYISDFINPLLDTHLSIPIATFGVMVALAILVASALAKREIIRFEQLGIFPERSPALSAVAPHSLVANLTMICAISGIVGARIFHILEYPAEFLADPMAMIFSRQGLSIYGGLIVGALAGAIYVRRCKVAIIPMLDAFAPALALGYGIGRIGCQLSGDGDWGSAANMALQPSWLPQWLWAQTYDNNIAGVVIPSPGVYPTPLYETFMALGIFVLLWSLRKLPYAPGFMFSIYLLSSGFARLFIEKIRINSEYHFLGMSFTQAEFISVVLLGMGLVGVLKVAHWRYASKIGFSLLVIGALLVCSLF